MNWRGDEIIGDIERRVGQNVQAAGFFLLSRVRERLSTPGRTSTQVTTKSGKVRTKWDAYGSNPSSPGESPHKQRGTLRQRIMQSHDPARLTSRVGSTYKVLKFLELGTRGGKLIVPRSAKVLANKASGAIYGKRVVQGAIAPRPTLVPTLEANKQEVANIIAGKPTSA